MNNPGENIDVNPQQQQQQRRPPDKCNQYIKPEAKNALFNLRPRQDLCIHRFDEYSLTNGVLLLHNVGSGKTITSITLAINSLDWENGGPETRVILVVHPTGMFDEFMSDIQSNILNIERLPYSIDGRGRRTECITDETSGIRRYTYKKNTDFINRGGNWQAQNNPPQFYIESIQYNELAKYFAKYDESIQKIRTIFENKIVIIDEAHRLFRQFDPCDKSSMLITKYINDNLLAGAKKIIAMTGTPLKNGISDMLSLLKLINIANITNVAPNAPIFTIPAYKQFDITNKETFKNLRKTNKKTIDPRFLSAIKCACVRTATAFCDFLLVNRSDLSVKYPSFTDKYIRDCAKLNEEAGRKGSIFGNFELIKLMIAEATGYGRGTSVSNVWKIDMDLILYYLGLDPNAEANAQANAQPRIGGGRKYNKTRKMRGGINIKSEEEARQLLEIPDDVPKTELKNKAKLQYRKLSLIYHPDKNIGVPGASDKFDKIRSAYDFIVSDKDGSEEKEEEKITYYYSIVVNNVFLTTFVNWSADELRQFKKNMEYILLNTDFKYFSIYDLLVEFAAYNSFDYIDLLTENLEDIKNVTLSEFEDLNKNYENEKEEDYKLFFKTDHEMFNDLYVEKDSIKFIEYSEEDDEEDLKNFYDSNTGEDSDASTPGTEEFKDQDRVGTAEYQSERLKGSQSVGGGKYDNEYNNDYVNLIYGDFPNQIELNSLFNKIKNAKRNNDELNNLLGDIPPNVVQNIKDNSKKIEQLVTEIQPVLTRLTSKFELLIENQNKESNMITQNGGNGLFTAVSTLVVFQGFLSILKEINIDIGDLVKGIISGLLPSVIANFLTSIVNYTLLLPQTIRELIVSGSISDLLDMSNILGFFKKIIFFLPTQVYDSTIEIYNLFKLYIPILSAIPIWKKVILGSIILYGGKISYEWYFYNTSIAALDKKSWFRNLSIKLRESLRKLSKTFSFYSSTPDELGMFNIAEKNNWVRKRNSLKIKLYRDNAFFEFDYDKFVAISKPIVSTITVLMPTLNDTIYNKILNTNLYTIEQIYNQRRLFVDGEFKGYPNRQSLPILSCYDTYQYYAFNQFKNILKELDNNKYIDYINHYIPWYLNKKNLLDTKLLGNLSIDTSYPLSSFKDTTKSIVYFDFNQQKYILNVDQERINEFHLNDQIGDSTFRIYKSVNEITFSCKKFEKILNYLILMKTGYMVDITNNVWTCVPQAHLVQHEVNNENIKNIADIPELYNSVHNITPATTHYFLPFVYSISDEMGLNLFAYFLEKKGYNYKVLHELSSDESQTKKETIKKSYPIINIEGNAELKAMRDKFFLENIVHTLDNKEFEERFGQQLRRDPICVLLHPFKTEGIDAKYNPAIFLLEPALNFGDYEQLCGRVLRSYDGRATYNVKPKKMIYQCLTSSRNSLNKFSDNYSFLKKDLDVLEEDYFSVKNFFNVKDISVIDPYSNYELKNSYLSYYCPSFLNYMVSNLAKRGLAARGAVGAALGGIIGTVTPIGPRIGALIGSIGVGVITSQATPKTNEVQGEAIGARVILKDALVPNTILDYAIYASLENTIYTYKSQVVKEDKNFDSNFITILKKKINDLDRGMQDLVEAIKNASIYFITSLIINFEYSNLFTL